MASRPLGNGFWSGEIAFRSGLVDVRPYCWWMAESPSDL